MQLLAHILTAAVHLHQRFRVWRHRRPDITDKNLAEAERYFSNRNRK